MERPESQQPLGQDNNQDGNQNNNAISQQSEQEQQLRETTTPVSNVSQHIQGPLQSQQQQSPLSDYIRGTWNNPAPHNQPHGTMDLPILTAPHDRSFSVLDFPMLTGPRDQQDGDMDLTMFPAIPTQPYGTTDLDMIAATPADPPATPTRPAAEQNVSSTPRASTGRASASRSGNNALRPPRARAAVPSSDPPIRVPANYLFPQVPEQVGEGLGSGRNWLVSQIGSQDPVLRAPLLITRCKKDSINQQVGTAYPNANQVIPAGTSLQQICQNFPRHVWGEMLRIFLSERWDARRIWDLLPANMRNNSSSRPWNYLQAAMGREVDTMMQEDTGIRRVPLKKARTPTPTPEEGAAQLIRDSSMIRDDGSVAESDMVADEEPANDEELLEGVNWSNHQFFSVPQLQAVTRMCWRGAHHAQRALLAVKYNSPGCDMYYVRRFYRSRHAKYFQGMLEDWERRAGRPMPTRDAAVMCRLSWELLNPRPAGMSPLRYRFLAEWYGTRNYALVVKRLWDEIKVDYQNLVGGELHQEGSGGGEVN